EGAHLGQSAYLRDVHGREDGAPPLVDLAREKKTGDFVRALIADGLVQACHDISDGGLACAAAGMAVASNVGVALGYQGPADGRAFLFGEDQARYVIALPQAGLAALDRRAQAAGVDYLVVGEAGGREISYFGADTQRDAVSLDVLRRLN